MPVPFPGRLATPADSEGSLLSPCFGNLIVPDYQPGPTPDGFEVRYWSTVGNSPHGSGLRADLGLSHSFTA